MIGVVIVEHAKSLAEWRQSKMCCIVRPAGLGGALGRLQERLVHFRCWMLVGSGGLVGVVCRVGVVAAGLGGASPCAHCRQLDALFR